MLRQFAAEREAAKQRILDVGQARSRPASPGGLGKEAAAPEAGEDDLAAASEAA
jgi:hypothetical protein